MKRTLTIATLLTLGAAALMPLPSLAQVGVNVHINAPPPPRFVAHVNSGIEFAPPAPRYEHPPRYRRGYVWSPGHWQWAGHRHVWVRGSYVRERPGYVYAQPAWVQRDGHWYHEPSRWTRHGRDRDHDGIPDRYEGRDRDRDGIPDRLERRDRDRDGIPDAYDRDRDNDGIRNRYDRDRDGDGVSNRRDRRPDNPYRR
jgi:hypothetical protein